MYEAITLGAEDGLESILVQDNVILGVDDMPRVKHGHYCANPSRPRYVHIDLSMTGDRCGIGMVRYDGLVDVERSNGIVEKLPMGTVEIACSIEPDANNEIQFSEVRTWVKQLRDMYGYPIKAVTYDGQFSTESIQQLRKQGMKTGHLSVDKAPSVAYKQLRDTFNDGRLKLFVQDVLVNELFELEYDETKDKVDHPVNGSKDVADAVCGAYYSMLQRRAAWVQLANEEEQMKNDGRAEFGDRLEFNGRL
jgi:hypothetical protein